MEYTIIEEHTVAKLIKLVNQFIAEGWKPLGGMTAIGLYLYQTMIRENK
jgi:hypothetical protein